MLIVPISADEAQKVLAAKGFAISSFDELGVQQIDYIYLRGVGFHASFAGSAPEGATVIGTGEALIADVACENYKDGRTIRWAFMDTPDGHNARMII